MFRLAPTLRSAAALCLGGTLLAWSPRFHEAQTRMALSRVPTRMATLLRTHSEALLRGARGLPRDRFPTVEEVEVQFDLVLRLSRERRDFDLIARELGTLAHQVQLLTDPSCIQGVTPLRDHFEAYGDEMLPHLVLTAEPYWELSGVVDPRPRLLELARVKTERLALLDAHFDERSRKRLVVWDRLSVPFALLQLSYTSGVHATANLWIQLYRVAGNGWAPSQ